jgi:hypothetical protein
MKETRRKKIKRIKARLNCIQGKNLKKEDIDIVERRKAIIIEIKS